MEYYFEAITTYDKEAVRHYTTYHYRHVDRRGPLAYLVLGGAVCLPCSLAVLDGGAAAAHGVRQLWAGAAAGRNPYAQWPGQHQGPRFGGRPAAGEPPAVL